MKQAEFNRFHEKYLELLPRFELLKDEAVHTLKEAICMYWINVHSITERIKGFDSCVNKVKYKKIEEPFKDIKDFVGL